MVSIATSSASATETVDATTGALMARVGRALDSRRLRLILLPTEQCNFRCTYCYEDFELGRMARDTVDSVKGLIRARSADLDRLEIDWFGGEPLLAMDIIEDVSAYAGNFDDLSFRGAATTNGYLLDESRLRRLLNVGVRHFQISLDGYGLRHDRSRMLAGGGSTFARIWDNLLAARDTTLSFDIMLRIHFSPDNLPGVPELVRQISQELKDDPRFHVLFKAVGHYGGPNDSTFDVFTWAEQDKIHRELKALLGPTVRAQTLSDHAVHMCYAAEPNALVIRSNGRLAKCTVAFADPRNDVGDLAPGGELRFDNPRLQAWFTGLFSLDAEQLRCPHEAMGPQLVQLRAQR